MRVKRGVGVSVLKSYRDPVTPGNKLRHAAVRAIPAAAMERASVPRGVTHLIHGVLHSCGALRRFFRACHAPR